jgi:hypothetical protein
MFIYIYIHTHSGILFSHKENEIMSFAGKWMEMDIIILSDISQVQKDKDFILSLICRRQIQMIDIYTNTSINIYVYICVNICINTYIHTGHVPIVGLFEDTKGRRDRKTE